MFDQDAAEHELDLAEVYLNVYGNDSGRVIEHIQNAIDLLDLLNPEQQIIAEDKLEQINFLRYMCR